MGLDVKDLKQLARTLAKEADKNGNGNNKLDTDKEISIFKSSVYAQDLSAKEKNTMYEYMGLDFTTAEYKKENKLAQEHTLRQLENIVNSGVTPEEFMKHVDARLGEGYQGLKNEIAYVLDLVNKTDYNSKETAELLEDVVKKELKEDKEDPNYEFRKDVLKQLALHAQATQYKKEFDKMKDFFNDNYDPEKNNLEDAMKKVKEKFGDRDSYYKDILANGSFANKVLRLLTFRKNKKSTFEKEVIMPEARKLTREAIYKSKSTDSKDVKKDAKTTLNDNGDYDKYTKKALNGENNTVGQWISATDSDMKIARKNQARKNTVQEAKFQSKVEILNALEGGLFKQGGIYRKNREALFNALIESGLVKETQTTINGEKQYDLTALSDIIRQNLGGNYKQDRHAKIDEKISEKTNTTAALAYSILMENLTENDAEALARLCGFPKEGKNLGKIVLGALFGGLAGAAGSTYAEETRGKTTIHNIYNSNNHIELNLKGEFINAEEALGMSQADMDAAGIVATATKTGLQIIIDQNKSVEFFYQTGKKLVPAALKGALFAAAAGALAGLKDSGEYAITATQFDCVSLEEYKANVAKISPEYAEALTSIAMTFQNEDGTWNCEEYKMFLNNFAGNGGKLNKEELIAALLEKTKAKNPPTTSTQTTDEVECENCTATKGKDEDTYVDVKIPTLKKSDAKTWWAVTQTLYPCLVQEHGLGKATSLVKAAQAVTDGNYDADRLMKYSKMSVSALRELGKVEGFNMKYYIDLRLAQDLPDNVFVPDSIAGCNKENKTIGNVEYSKDGNGTTAKTDFTGYKKKTADGKEYVQFCDGTKEYIKEGETAQDVVNAKEEAMKKDGKNVKITLQ